VNVTRGGVAGRLAATAAGRKIVDMSMGIVQRVFQCTARVQNSGAMLGAERGDDRLALVLTTAAVTHPVQGDYDIFANTRNGSVQRRAFHHDASTGDLGRTPITFFFDEIGHCFQRRL
jgi:hypothetical protein